MSVEETSLQLGKWLLKTEPLKRILFHSDRGVQYVKEVYQRLILIKWLQEA
jgi:hypothetical protein